MTPISNTFRVKSSDKYNHISIPNGNQLICETTSELERWKITNPTAQIDCIDPSVITKLCMQRLAGMDPTDSRGTNPTDSNPKLIPDDKCHMLTSW